MAAGSAARRFPAELKLPFRPRARPLQPLDDQLLGNPRLAVFGLVKKAGRLIDFLLVPGQAHELAPSLTLWRRLPQAPVWTLADMACDAAAFRRAVATRYDKTAMSYAAGVAIAASLDWIKS